MPTLRLIRWYNRHLSERQPKTDNMKTAIQELIEYIESNEILYNKDLILKLKELFNKEKDQIQKSYKDHHDLGHIYGLDTEQYYNQTYNHERRV